MRQPMHQNPAVRIIAAIGAVFLMAVAVFVGALFFLAFLGLAIIAFVGFQLRLWWIRRRFAGTRRRQHTDAAGSGRAGANPGRMIEGEFRRHSDDRTD